MSDQTAGLDEMTDDKVSFLGGVASVLTAKMHLAGMAAAFVYHGVVAVELDPSKWHSGPAVQPLISVALNFAKKTVGDTSSNASELVPDASLVVAALRQIHAAAGRLAGVPMGSHMNPLPSFDPRTQVSQPP